MKKQAVYTSIDDLRDIISVLSSSEEKYNFLESIYEPGNEAVVKLILEINGKLSGDILKKELFISMKNKDEERIIEYGSLYIDYYVENDLFSFLPDILLELKNDKLTKLVLDKLPKSENKEDIGNAYRLYKGLGINNAVSKLLGSILLKYALTDGYPGEIGGLMVDSGQYTEAIEYYFKSYDKTKKGHVLSNAWEVAKKNSPDSKKWVAQKIWSVGLIDDMSEVTFAESAKELGYTKNAVSIFQKHIKKQDYNSIRSYYDLVAALKIIGGMDREIEKIVYNCEDIANEPENYPRDKYNEMAELCFVAGYNEKYKDWITRVINYEVKNCNISHSQSTVSRYEKNTKDESLRILLIPVLEKERDYVKAAEITKKLGMEDHAIKYKKLAELVKLFKRKD